MDKKSNTLVVQSNPLIQSRRDFTVLESRIFYIGLRDLKPRLTDKEKPWITGNYKEFPITTIPANELVKLFGNKWYYSTIRDVCRNFAKRTIEIKSTNESDFEVYPVFAMLKFSAEKGLTLAFNPFMIPWLLDLADKAYTKIPFEEIWSLRSPYAIRLFELLLQYQNMPKHERTLTVEELRQYLGVPDERYADRADNFKRYIVDSSVKAINESTSYKVKAETVKEKRKTVAFKFTLHLPAEVKKQKAKAQIKDIQNLINGMADDKAMTPQEEKPTISEEQRAKNQKRLKELMGNIKGM